MHNTWEVKQLVGLKQQAMSSSCLKPENKYFYHKRNRQNRKAQHIMYKHRLD